MSFVSRSLSFSWFFCKCFLCLLNIKVDRVLHFSSDLSIHLIFILFTISSIHTSSFQLTIRTLYYFSLKNPNNNFKMQFNIVALAAVFVTAMAGPVYNPCGGALLYSVPQCCDTDVLGVADLGCSTRTYLTSYASSLFVFCCFLSMKTNVDNSFFSAQVARRL